MWAMSTVLDRSRTEVVVTTADCFASQIMGMIPVLDEDELHEALSGALLLFLAEVASE